MALHDELAELRAEVGPQVFDDPVAFRAAFDDFVPEGSATTGEVSLLVGAIATGALQRLREQLALGADPEMTIAVQGDLLARDRGTSESHGARWALSVLAHATGAVPATHVLTRPTPGPGSIGTAGRPPATTAARSVDPAPAPPAADRPGPESPASSERATLRVGTPAGSPEDRDPGAGRGRTLVIGAVVVLLLAASAALAALLWGDDDDDPGGGSGSADEEVLAELDITEGGEPARVRLVHDGAETEVVLLLQRDGEFTEVDRKATACPFLESSYAATIQDTEGPEIYWGWDNLDQEGFGQYGHVLPEIESLDVFGVEEGYECPTE